MKREILFRGKNIDGGKWVCGNLIIEDDWCSISTGPLEIALDEGYWEHSCGYPPSEEHFHIENIVEVDSNTIGEYTGLKDKNGVEIFEGDIVEAWSEGYKHIGEIRWRLEGQPAIIIYPAFANQGFWKIHGDKGIDIGVEIIGNIHDNPELINK